jgi:hypothetical protein
MRHVPLPLADVLYLFGKVSASSSGSNSSSSWQSCCVVVPNLHRSLLVVPRPSVFDDSDGEIAALEAAVAADPARKIELLQVCPCCSCGLCRLQVLAASTQHICAWQCQTIDTHVLLGPPCPTHVFNPDTPSQPPSLQYSEGITTDLCHCGHTCNMAAGWRCHDKYSMMCSDKHPIHSTLVQPVTPGG